MPIYKGSTNQGLVYHGSPNTNCITSVPKNITLTYNAGVFTVHAGSIITVPYGGGTALNVGDKIGTVLEVVKVVGNYIQLKLLTDYSDTFGGSTSTLYVLNLGFNTNGNMYWSGTEVSANTSGSTDSSASISDGSLYFNTTNNIIYRRYGNGTTGYQFGGGINGVWISLPIACHYGAPTKAEQIFDWCGYIGSTQFFLPGIKGLKSNGLKADGTYNNIEIETKSVMLNQYDYTTSNQQVGIGANANYPYRTSYYYSQATAPTVTPYSVWHNTKDNFNYSTGADTSLGWVKEPNFDFPAITSISTDSSFKITSLTPAKVQPLQTGIQITKVYKESTLVYMFGFDPVTFTANGTWKVPPGIRQIRVDCVAGQGFSNAAAQGGYGGRVQCILNVTPGQILGIKVGNQNIAFNVSENASAIYTGGAWTSGYLVIAGGGGGAAYTNYLQIRSFAGGIGGGLTGGIGGNIAGAANNNAIIGIAGGGGSQIAGGARGYFSMYLKSLYATNGSQFTGGAPNAERSLSGAGGQGFFGGGGAVEGYYYKGSSAYGASCAAAGGGSSYTHPTLCSSVVHTQGYKAGNGYITISMV